MKRGKKVLTKRTVDALKTVGCYTDRDLPGFALRVLPTGTKIFQARYVPRGGGARRTVSLGVYGVVTLDKARGRAKEILGSAAIGDDPVADKRRVPTWKAWSSTFFERLSVKSKEVFHRRFLGLTDEENRWTGKETDSTFREIRARWGPRPLDSFRPDDIEEERQRLRAAGKSRTTVNRWLAVTAACFSAAVQAELLGKNPAAKVKADRENPARSRVLTPEEMGRLLAALENEPDRYAAAAVLLAILTGARRGEILGLRWDQVNFEEGFARLPDSKSGRPRFLPLTERGLEMLRSLSRNGPFVIAGLRPEAKEEEAKRGPTKKREPKPRPDLKRAWQRLSTAASIEGATFHDLRRTFSRELNRAAGLRVAQEALGHTTPDQTAAAYTPEGFDAVKAAAESRAKLLPFPVTKAG